MLKTSFKTRDSLLIDQSFWPLGKNVGARNLMISSSPCTPRTLAPRWPFNTVYNFYPITPKIYYDEFLWLDHNLKHTLQHSSTPKRLRCETKLCKKKARNALKVIGQIALFTKEIFMVREIQNKKDLPKNSFTRGVETIKISLQCTITGIIFPTEISSYDYLIGGFCPSFMTLDIYLALVSWRQKITNCDHETGYMNHKNLYIDEFLCQEGSEMHHELVGEKKTNHIKDNMCTQNK